MMNLWSLSLFYVVLFPFKVLGTETLEASLFYEHLKNTKHEIELEEAQVAPYKEGSHGKVYRVTIDGFTFAMKCSELIFGMDAELRHLDLFQQTYVVKHYGMPFKGKYRDCYAMKLYDSDLLHANLKDHYLPKEITQFALQLVDATIFIHNKGFYVNDLKPQNALLSKADGEVVLADFGMVTEHVQTGTLFYTGFEIPNSRAHDVYGFALTYLQMLGVSYGTLRSILQASIRVEHEQLSFTTARRAFSRKKYEALLTKYPKYMAHKPAVFDMELPGVPESIRKLLQACTHYVPIKRPNFDQIRQVLQAFVSGASSSEPALTLEDSNLDADSSNLPQLLAEHQLYTISQKPVIDIKHIEIFKFVGMLHLPDALDGVFEATVFGFPGYAYISETIPTGLFKKPFTYIVIPAVDRQVVIYVEFTALATVQVNDKVRRFENVLIFQMRQPPENDPKVSLLWAKLTNLWQ